jgi:hypothetical protein
LPFSLKGSLLSIVFVLANEMHRLRNNKKNNVITRTAAVTTTIILLVVAITTGTTTTQLASAWVDPDIDPARQQPKAPPVISGENVIRCMVD